MARLIALFVFALIVTLRAYRLYLTAVFMIVVTMGALMLALRLVGIAWSW